MDPNALAATTNPESDDAHVVAGRGGRHRCTPETPADNTESRPPPALRCRLHRQGGGERWATTKKRAGKFAPRGAGGNVKPPDGMHAEIDRQGLKGNCAEIDRRGLKGNCAHKRNWG